MIGSYFEYDGAKIIKISSVLSYYCNSGKRIACTNSPCCVFDYLALYGSLDAIEIASWYMTSGAESFAMRPVTTQPLWNLYGNDPPKRHDDMTFRSCAQDRGRNPLDIFNIWQHTAWESHQLLMRHVPNDIANIILGYGMQSLAPPKHHHGITHFFDLQKSLHTFYLFCILDSFEAKLELVRWRTSWECDNTSSILFSHAIYSDDPAMVEAYCILGQLPTNGYIRQMQLSYWATQFFPHHVSFGITWVPSHAIVGIVYKHLEQFDNASLLKRISPQFHSKLFDFYCNHITPDCKTHYSTHFFRDARFYGVTEEFARQKGIQRHKI